MSDLVERLRLIAAWHRPGGATPSSPMPSRHKTATEAADRIEYLEQVEQAFNLFVQKTEWVQTTNLGGAKALGLHRADIMTNEIRRLQAALDPLASVKEGE